MDVAIIGLGGRIIDVWSNLTKAAGGRVRLVGYADPCEPVGLPRLAKLGLEAGRGFTDHHEMLRTLKPDAVMIGSPNHLHLEHIRDALAAGCRVFSEKPVVISPEDTWKAAELFARNGTARIQVGLVLRSSPFFRSVTANLPRLGRLVSLEANEHLHPEHGGFIMRDWRRKRAWSGSHILEKCCHDLDLLQAVAGRVVRAASFGSRAVFTPEQAGRMHDGRYQGWGKGWQGVDSPFENDGDIIDNQVAICETDRGVRLTFHTNTHAAIGQRRWLLCGADGSLEGDFGLPELRLRRVYEEQETVRFAAEGAGHYGADEAMGRDLAACWLDGAAFPVPAKAALEAGLAAMAIDLAQREGRVVDASGWMRQLDSLLP